MSNQLPPPQQPSMGEADQAVAPSSDQTKRTKGPPVPGQPDYYRKLHAVLQQQLRDAVDSLQMPNYDADPELFVANKDHQALADQLDPQARKEREENLEQKVKEAQTALTAHQAQGVQLEILALLAPLDLKALEACRDHLDKFLKNKSKR